MLMIGYPKRGGSK